MAHRKNRERNRIMAKRFAASLRLIHADEQSFRAMPIQPMMPPMGYSVMYAPFMSPNGQPQPRHPTFAAGGHPQPPGLAQVLPTVTPRPQVLPPSLNQQTQPARIPTHQPSQQPQLPQAQPQALPQQALPPQALPQQVQQSQPQTQIPASVPPANGAPAVPMVQ